MITANPKYAEHQKRAAEAMSIEELEEIMSEGLCDAECPNCHHIGQVEPDAEYDCYECGQELGLVSPLRILDLI